MSTWAMTTADEFAQSEIYANAVTGTVDTWIGSRLRIKRTMRGLTQREFSELLKVDRNELAAFETGAKRINANLLFRIAKSLDVRPDYFFRGYVEEAPRA
jgi:transcriptional regulator with XRE-family HTH domain